VQDRAAGEVREVLAGRPVSAPDLSALPLLTAVVKEALRLYPPAFASGRRLTGGDDEVSGYRIPDGADVGVYPWATHRHPRHWDDPERFDPGRFAPEREAARHRYAWFPFGGGPHACIGSHFALVEALTTLAALLQAVRVETPDRPLELVPRLTLQPTGPVPARLRPR
jgi:cytochrome P450